MICNKKEKPTKHYLHMIGRIHIKMASNELLAILSIYFKYHAC